jgi:ribosomal protein S18 acetylase RimI-like enzyme
MIRKAEYKDLDSILEIVEDARNFLKSSGSKQWQEQYPAREDFFYDLENDYLYVCEEEGILIGTASLVREKDENYDEIFSGKWLNEEPYYSVHRIAVRKEVRGLGISKILLQYLETLTLNSGVRNIKVDTTEENIIMKKLLENNGYEKCGVIYLKRTETYNKRLAYQKILNA